MQKSDVTHSKFIGAHFLGNYFFPALHLMKLWHYYSELQWKYVQEVICTSNVSVLPHRKIYNSTVLSIWRIHTCVSMGKMSVRVWESIFFSFFYLFWYNLICLSSHIFKKVSSISCHSHYTKNEVFYYGFLQ